MIFQQQFITFLKLSPNEKQLELIDLFETFLKTKDPFPLMLLKGYAGTGKTTMVGTLVKTLAHFKVNTVLLAPTGRAAKVMSIKSNKKAFTIHKLIYRRKSSTNVGFNTPLLLAPNLMSNTLFIVDEASMIADYAMDKNGNIGRNLLEDLLEFVYSAKNCKLLFVGDQGQLPPVGSDFSPALNEDYLTKTFPQITLFSFVLKEILRQKESSGILQNAFNLRPEGKQKKIVFNPNQIDFIKLTGEDMHDALESAFGKYGLDETMVICRSNKRANAFNHQIRNRILWREEQLVGGDLLMVVRNNYFWLEDNSPLGFIANGEIVEVKKVMRIDEMYGLRFATLRVAFVDYPNMEPIEVKAILDVLDVEQPNLPREVMKHLFFEVEKDYAHELNKKKRYELILKDPYFNALQIKYAYAVTCHKSQGGEWACVFIDQGFIEDDMINDEFKRWLYTAITRASEKVYLVNFNETFFS
jgi:exodeoxyribonuclease-5